MAAKPTRSRAASKAKPVLKAIPIASSQIGDGTISGIIAGAGASRVPDIETFYYLGTKHPIVRSCIELIADTVAAEGFDIVAQDEDVAKPMSAKDDPRVKDVNTFFRQAFPNATFAQWRWAASFDLLAFGYSLLRKKSAGGTVQSLERMDPRCVVAKLNAKKTEIESYVVRPRSVNGRVDPTQIEYVPAKEVILFSRFGGDPITGFPSPLESLDLTLFCDFAARRFRSAFFSNGGVPSMIVTTASSSEDTVQMMADSLMKQKSGPQNAYKMWVLAGEDVKVNEIGEAGKHDADFVQASGLNREDVCAVYKVPVGMLTFSSNALGSSGKGHDQDFFEQFAVLPLEELLYDRLTISLLADIFDIDDLVMVPKRRNRIRFDRFDAAFNAVKFGATGNEARKMVNLQPIADPQYQMDAPLFITVRGQGVAADEGGGEPVNPASPAPKKPASSKPSDTGAAGASADAASKEHDKNEVGQKAARRFPFGY